jgi:hypothetical protein
VEAIIIDEKKNIIYFTAPTYYRGAVIELYFDAQSVVIYDLNRRVIKVYGYRNQFGAQRGARVVLKAGPTGGDQYSTQ